METMHDAQDRQGFRIYHFGWGGFDPELCKTYEDMGFMNHFPSGDRDWMKHIQSLGGAIWQYLSPFTQCEETKKWYLSEGWQQQLDDQVAQLKRDGVWDAVVGFEFDEPMLRVVNEDFEQVSRYLTKFGKRQMAIFSVYELVEGSHPRSDDPEFGMTGHVIRPESCQYLTDIAFDMYGVNSYSYLKLLTEEMKRRVGREDVYVWQVPCTWSDYNTRDENHAIGHLDNCYRLLKEQKRPGGLICYNWRSFRKTGESLDWLFSPENPERWAKLEARMVEIGREICQQPLVPLK